MKDRPFLRSLLLTLATAVLAALGVRFGVPPAPLPPVIVTPPTAPPHPTPPVVPSPPAPRPDAARAIARIQFGSAGCSATVIGPRRDDGKYWVLTAAHCVSRVGQHGTLRLLDGRTTGIVVAAIDKTSDCCWCYTEQSTEVFPFALLAERAPPVGAKVWHAGYGVHVPGNREAGYVEALPNGDGQCRFRLSVSNGDSGGGICLNESGEVISPVCCTSRLAGAGSVWGASPEAARRLKPTAMVLDDWTPIELPIRIPDPMPASRP